MSDSVILDNMTISDTEEVRLVRDARVEAPTEPGFYYASRWNTTIRPVEVMEMSDGLYANFMSTTHYPEPVGMFAWYGPVPDCVGS